MMHPKRFKYLPYLVGKLGDVRISVDKINNIWNTSRRAWLMYDSKAEYHIVIQDDAIIGKDFIKKAEAMMKEDAIYNFYIGRPRFYHQVLKAKKEDKKFLIQRNLHHEIAFGMRTNRIDEMIKFVEKIDPDSDRCINGYVRAKKLKVIFPMPSLIDHRNEDTLHNLNKGSYKKKATWFIGE